MSQDEIDDQGRWLIELEIIGSAEYDNFFERVIDEDLNTKHDDNWEEKELDLVKWQQVWSQTKI
jgi:hypothetical protein